MFPVSGKFLFIRFLFFPLFRALTRGDNNGREKIMQTTRIATRFASFLSLVLLTIQTSPIAAAGPQEQSENYQSFEVTFTKWITGVTPPPAPPFPPGDPGQTIILMSGFTGGDAPGTFAGEVLYRKVSNDLSIAQLWPIYKVSAGNRSFTALIQGGSNAAGLGLLEGVIMDGWRTGARVRVRFQRMTNCENAPAGTCFKGTIRILRDNPED
jgi:hypothetical protein